MLRGLTSSTETRKFIERYFSDRFGNFYIFRMHFKLNFFL